MAGSSSNTDSNLRQYVCLLKVELSILCYFKWDFLSSPYSRTQGRKIRVAAAKPQSTNKGSTSWSKVTVMSSSILSPKQL